MTTVNLTLLLGFSMKKTPSEKKAEKAKKQDKGKEEKVKGVKGGEKKIDEKQAKKQQKEKKLASKMELHKEESIVKPKNLFEVGPPQRFAHIEYEMLPERAPFKIDVNCWGDFAKIYCEDDVRAIRTIQINEIAWVPVKVKHFFKCMTKGELLQLQFHVIKITIWNLQDKLDLQARFDRTQSFYTFHEHLENNGFVEVFDKSPSEEKNYEDYLKEERLNTELRLFKKCAFRGDSKTSNLVYLNYFPDEIHDHMVKKMIEDINSGVPIRCKEFVRVWSTSSDAHMTIENLVVDDSNSKTKQGTAAGRKKKDKKDKKDKKAISSGPLAITISGEVFFTDPNMTVHRIAKSDPEIYDGYALLTVKNLMTRTQKNEMNPLVINVKKVLKLPAAVLAKHGFQWIRTKYNVPQVAQCITTEKPISETIHINESHVFFLENTPEGMLYDFFYTKHFIIELVGIRRITGKVKAVKQASLFGTDNSDIKFSNRLQPFQCLKTNSQEERFTAIQLAVASFDISSLLQYSWCFIVESACINPDTALSMKTSDPLLFTDVINAQELNLDSFKEARGVSCLTDDILMDAGTSIILEMFLQAPQSALLKYHTLPCVFQRLLIITSDDLLATNLLNQILLHNQKFLTPEVITSDYLKSGMRVILDKDSTNIYFVDTKGDSSKDVITGFLLDNVTSYIFFIEGTPTGLITTLWNQVMHLPTSVANTHFNTKQVFAKRLYEELLPFGGFYTITLQTTLKNIMSQTHIYLKGSAPLPCWEALKRFDLLLRCKVFKSMCQLNLFPSTKQLLSLDIEFGVPLRWVRMIDGATKNLLVSEEKNTYYNTTAERFI